ncbi:unnamed protein product [Prorocentrum cordatum]|uniref:Uncharacterized protein n=1 Tax=Prorocentrum cordatum TaxID=2364126 RepID=A0ABN9TIW2_9DINO|nr:unnamed protein product [Polarella glacialis]
MARAAAAEGKMAAGAQLEPIRTWFFHARQQLQRLIGRWHSQPEKEREKLLADEIEAVTAVIDKEKVAQEHQLKEIARWADAQEQRVAKHQYQLDKATREHVASIRAEHQVAVRGRVEKQHAITESIASFISGRYREKMDAPA